MGLYIVMALITLLILLIHFLSGVHSRLSRVAIDSGGTGPSTPDEGKRYPR